MKQLRKMLIALMVASFTMGSVALAANQAAPAAKTPPAAAAKMAPAKKVAQKPVKKHHHKAVASAEVKAVQEALNTHGVKLKVDGLAGRQTRNAIKKFQKENGLKVTGHANKATRLKLGLKK